ncbi:hypothetical protein [Nocardia sp. NPDC048505]|uniref:hypothetical protein n=1 Tax=unclassified Nocardia TaxID=2637762 RepID=UPI0034074583
MISSTRTVRISLAALAITAGLVTAAGPAAAETPGTGSSSGSAELGQKLIEAFACAVGAQSCPIIIRP